MLPLKLLATAATVMSSIVAAAPTGSPDAQGASTDTPTEHVETNLDCHREFQDCLWDSPVAPVTLAWYANCADKYRDCIDPPSTQKIEARKELVVDCDALLQECLNFHKPRTLAMQKSCEMTYQACQLAHPPNAKREVSDAEDPATDNSSVLSKRDDCRDECAKNFDLCLHSLGSNPPANWWLYCSELQAKCNGNCPPGRLGPEAPATDNSAVLPKRDDCRDECVKNFDLCLHSLGANPPANWWLYCSELQAKCNGNCPGKRSIVNDDADVYSAQSLIKRSDCTDECEKNYDLCLYSLGGNPPANWWLYCSELQAKCKGNCPAKRSSPSPQEDISAPAAPFGIQDCYDDCSKELQKCLDALGPNPAEAGKVECKSKEILCRPKCPCFEECNSDFYPCIFKPAEQVDHPEVQTATCTAALIVCYGVCGTNRSGAPISEVPSSNTVVVDDVVAPEAPSTLTKRTDCTDECYDNYLGCLGSLGPHPPQHWHLYCHEGLANCNGNCPPE